MNNENNNQYGGMQQSENTLGVNQMNSTPYGGMPQQGSTTVANQMNSTPYGAVPQPESTSVANQMNSTLYGGMPQQGSMPGVNQMNSIPYGAVPQPESTPGANQMNSTLYGGMPQQGSMPGVNQVNPNQYGRTPQYNNFNQSMPVKKDNSGTIFLIILIFVVIGSILAYMFVWPEFRDKINMKGKWECKSSTVNVTLNIEFNSNNNLKVSSLDGSESIEGKYKLVKHGELTGTATPKEGYKYHQMDTEYLKITENGQTKDYNWTTKWYFGSKKNDAHLLIVNESKTGYIEYTCVKK